MEILDLIAKVSWDANTAELAAMNKELKAQDKMLDELRQRGQRLEAQMKQTNDPKKAAEYSRELVKTKSNMDKILETQRKQTEATKALNEQQKRLYAEIQKVTDPKQYQRMVNEIAKVEQKLASLSTKTADIPSKLNAVKNSFSGIGGALLGGIGLGAGSLGLESLVSGITNFVTSANQQFIEAENTTLRFQNTLKSLGQEKYLDEMISEADKLAKSIGYIDNDDIVTAQEKLLTYGKVSRAEISNLLPIIIDLAARMGTDVPNATEVMINILEGRGGASLRQLGLSVKDAETTTERLGVVFEELAPKIAGSAEQVKNSSEGMQRQLNQQIADLQESLGESTIEIKNYFLQAYAGFLTLLNNVFTSEEQKRLESQKSYMQERATEAKNLSDKELAFEQSLMKTKINDIKEAQKIIFKLEAENAKSGLDYIGKLRISENEKQIAAQRDFVMKRETEVRAIIDESNSREQRNAEEAAFKLKRIQEDKTEADIEAQKKRAEAAKKAYDDEIKRIAELRKVIEADRVKLDEIRLSADEREKNEINRKYDELAKAAKGYSDILLQIEANRANAILAIERRKNIEFDRLNASELTTAKETLNDKASASAKVAIEISKNIQFEESKKAELAQKDKERRENEKQDLTNSLQNAAAVTQSLLSFEQARIDGLMSLQEKRISEARNDSAKSLKIEEDRYQQLLQQRAEYERAQRSIDAAVIIANQAVAISAAIRAIAEGGKLGPAGVAAQVIAIGAGLASVLLAVRNATADIPQFREGGYTGDGNPDSESTNLGRKPYIYHKREFVMDEGLTSKHRDLFEGLHKRELVVKQLDDGQFYIAPKGLDTNALIADHETIRGENMQQMAYELAGIRQLLTQREVNVNNNFDANGFGSEIATQLGRVYIKNKMR